MVITWWLRLTRVSHGLAGARPGVLHAAQLPVGSLADSAVPRLTVDGREA